MSEFLSRLDDWSDRFSPIAVKEVRQMVRGREFNYAFGAGLLAGLIIAFFGLADSLNLSGVSGSRIFSAMMVCLSVIGLAVVPLGGYAALRAERTDHTLDLVTQTALTPRRIVLGKLMTQTVKLLTLFSALSPFLAMSFLLGGIELTTILFSLGILFLWSIWACSAFLFLSATTQSRVGSSVMLALLVIAFFGLAGRFVFILGPFFGGGFGGPGAPPNVLWWTLAASSAFCIINMINMILLAENRLSLPIEDRSTALRTGFLVQFVFLLICFAGPIVVGAVGYSSTDATTALGILGGIQLAVVSIFAVSEDMVVSRRVLRTIEKSRAWALIFRPGGGRGAAWVLFQMFLFLGTALAFLTSAPSSDFKWMLGICSYVCFFTGVPVYVLRRFVGSRLRVSQVRGAVCVFIPVVTITADILQYMMGSSLFDGTYSAFHILNPFRTLANWSVVETQGWQHRAFIMGILGVVCYLGLIKMGQRESKHAGIPN